jgi:hypothetical protein
MLRPLMASVLASALALTSCDQQSPTAPADFSRPSFGATTERFTAPTAAVTGNEQGTIGLGGTAEQWAALCAGEEPEEDFDLMTVLIITRPDGSQKVRLKGQNLHILIWDIPGSIPFPGDFCGEDPVYTGTGRIIVTDSDVDLTHPGVDASGSTITGTVTDVAGQLYHLVAPFRFTVAENTPDNFVISAHASKIQLTPIGH